MAAADLAYDELRAKISAEKAAWPERYEAIRDAIALGFVPDAYGAVGRYGDAILAPPTKFGYPRGGLEYPLHSGGRGAGALLKIFTYRDGDPDELRHEPVWNAGKTSCHWHHLSYNAYGLTLDQAFAACAAFADHHLTHFIVPMWLGEDRHPCLKGEWWWELLALRVGPAQVQLGLFDADESADPLSKVQRAIRTKLMPDLADGLWQTIDAIRAFDLEQLIERANRIRADRGVPPVPEAA